MQLATRRMLLRSSPLAPCRRCVAPLSVRAFKEEHEVKHEKPEPEKLEFTREEAPGKPVTPPPVTPRADLAAPFRMRSLFDEMEKEVEQLTRTFEELSPFPFPRRRRLVDPVSCGFRKLLDGSIPTGQASSCHPAHLPRPAPIECLHPLLECSPF